MGDGLTGAPRLNVLVATYNQELYIRTALESVFAQETSFPFDVTVADDASTDGTRAIVDEFAARYPGRVRTIYAERNIKDFGVKTFCRALESCHAEYIAMLDGDDAWGDPCKLQRQVELLDARPECMLCFHACTMTYEESPGDEWTVRPPSGSESLTTDDFLRDAMVQMSTIVMRASLAQELVRHPGLITDWFIAVTASRFGPVAYIDVPMSIYRQHSSSVFGAADRAYQWAVFVEQYEHLKEILEPAYTERLEEGLCVRALLAAREYERSGDLHKAAKFLSRAASAKPEWLGPYCASTGASPKLFLRTIPLRLTLYRVPPAFYAWSALARIGDALRSRRLLAFSALRTHVRLLLGRPVGTIALDPSVARGSAKNPDAGDFRLEWSSAGTFELEVRVGRPDGLLLARTGSSGAIATGPWVTDGTLFFLQDVDHERPLTFAHTLAVSRARVERWIPKLRRARRPGTPENTPLRSDRATR